MRKDRFYHIFKKGSKTYFYNSLFFPRDVRDDVFKLYGFVREADNLVDTIPQRKEDFCIFREDFCHAWEGGHTRDQVLDSFVEMARRRDIPKDWTEGFLHSMELDLVRSTYNTLEEVEEYMYGSAEVIGLMMSRIIGVEKEFYPHARMLGRAMQYINFIRDIDEDLKLGRRYLPTVELDKHGLKDLTFAHVKDRLEDFSKFMEDQVERYLEWQREAEKGFGALERRYRLPIMNASEMYKWTAMTIRKDPLIVYREKVKPSKARIVLNLFKKKMTI